MHCSDFWTTKMKKEVAAKRASAVEIPYVKEIVDINFVELEKLIKRLKR